MAGLTDAGAIRRLLTEAVRGGHCDPASVVRELNQARLLRRPHVVDAVDSLLAEGRVIAEDRLYRMVREYGLPDPVWNVDLRLPGGPHLGGLDAYWPDQAVAVELDTRAPLPGNRQEDDALWSEYARKREHLERLGITVVHITPRKLREAIDQQATVVRTALMASGDRSRRRMSWSCPGSDGPGGTRRGEEGPGRPGAPPRAVGSLGSRDQLPQNSASPIFIASPLQSPLKLKASECLPSAVVTATELEPWMPPL